MSTVTEMKNAFINAMNNIDNYAKQIISQYDNELIKLLQDNLYQGKDGYGNYLRPYAWNAYAMVKNRMNSKPPFGTPDLYLAGSFYQKMQLEWLTDKSFSIISNDTKYRKLMKLYGFDVMKLSEEAIQYFRVNRFHREFIAIISRATGAEFS